MVKVLEKEPREFAEGESTTTEPNMMPMPSWLALNPRPSMVSEEPGEPVGWDKETVGITVKSVSLGWPPKLEALMVNLPLGTGGIVTSEDHWPWESAVACDF